MPLMRTNPTRLLFVALALLQVPAFLPSASAADLTVPVVGRHRGVIVADYDGTPIYLYRSRRIVRGYDGVEQVIDTSDAYPVLNIDNPITAAVPTRYLNGQPVR
jgi:hypothetical protein